MSFSTNFKLEILNKNQFETREEKLAFVSAVFMQNGSIHISKHAVNIEVENELQELVYRLATELKSLYDFEISISSKNVPYLKRNLFVLKLPAAATKQIAEDTGMIIYSGDMAIGFSDVTVNEYIDEKLIKAYLLGITLSSASVAVPIQSQNDRNIFEGGYSLDMRFNNENIAYSVMNYFAQFDIFLKKVNRNDIFSLYIRGSEMLSDFMAFFSGSNAVLELNDIIAYRSVRNDINRIKNCELANLDKSIEAGQKQYLAIKLIEEKIGLESLSEKLREIAIIRLENPDFTLEQIAELAGGDISKSGINHRFRKIMEIAKNLQE